MTDSSWEFLLRLMNGEDLTPARLPEPEQTMKTMELAEMYIPLPKGWWLANRQGGNGAWKPWVVEQPDGRLRIVLARKRRSK